VGYALLVYQWFSAPVSINGSAIAAFLLILAAICLLFAIGIVALEKIGIKQPDEKEVHDLNERLFESLKRQPWRFLFIPAEDGFFLLPLLYVGINPVSAAVAALLFACIHYPVFPWRYCVPKGVVYFFVALFILPHGIWSVIVAHFLVDVSMFGLGFLSKIEGKPILRRLARMIRTE
jgi:hypothetical protein